MDDKLIGNQFKQVEDALISLSKVLNSIQLVNAPQRGNHHQATPSSVVIFLCFDIFLITVNLPLK